MGCRAELWFLNPQFADERTERQEASEVKDKTLEVAAASAAVTVTAVTSS